MAAQAAINELAGKYRILAELGQGGTAQVWLAVATGPSDFNKLVVLKAMKPELIDEPELARMFMNEARLAARLNHPNVVQTNEVFENDGLPVIVMEYLDGQPLSQLLSRHRGDGGFPVELQIKVLSEALGGLHAAHELTDFDGTHLEVVHRDVSPHNVFVTYDGLVKILDFGIATLSGTGSQTESGVIKGKLHYMAPEQIIAGRVDRRADIYAAGVILWEMAAGTRMWRGLNEAVVMNRILNGELPRLNEVAPEAPEHLQLLIDRATAFDAEERYPTAEAFQLDLDEYLTAEAPGLRTRDLGRAAARLFSDRRRERRSVVEEQLSRVTSLTDDEYKGTEPLAITRLETAHESRAKEKKNQTARLIGVVPWLVVAALMILVGTLLFRPPSDGQLRSDGQPTEEPLAPAEQAPLSPPPPVPQGVEVIRLRVTAFPAHARVLLDGRRLGANPHLGEYPLDELTDHTLRAEAKGYLPAEKLVVLDRDQDLVLTLEKKKPRRSTSAKASGTTTPTAVEPPPRPPAPSDPCAPPYYFDERGIKKYKPECL